MAVESGTPLRLYLTKRVRSRLGAQVIAKSVYPVWSFDRITIPANSVVEGSIVRLNPVSKLQRTMSIVRGDFTPLKRAQVEFTRVRLSDGKAVDIVSQSSTGLGSVYVEPKAPKPGRKPRTQPSTQAPGKLERIKTSAKQAAQSTANSRTRGLFDLVRAPNRKEWLEEFLLAKLPYHPQWYVRGSRFDAVLEQPLAFATVQIPRQEFAETSSRLGPEQTANLRLTDTLNSLDAKPGDPIHAILAEPVFSSDHRLVLCEGTHVDGKVTFAKPARLLHRGGRLRFTFDQINPPAELTEVLEERRRTQAQVEAVEQGAANVDVDQEGTVKATESKTRFIRPAIAALVAAKSLDNDEDKVGSGGANANYSGRALGGFSGFGLFGTLVARAPKPIGAAFGFYGLAWSVYSTVISRGNEVVFEKNAAVQIRFGVR